MDGVSLTKRLRDSLARRRRRIDCGYNRVHFSNATTNLKGLRNAHSHSVSVSQLLVLLAFKFALATRRRGLVDER